MVTMVLLRLLALPVAVCCTITCCCAVPLVVLPELLPHSREIFASLLGGFPAGLILLHSRGTGGALSWPREAQSTEALPWPSRLGGLDAVVVLVPAWRTAGWDSCVELLSGDCARFFALASEELALASEETPPDSLEIFSMGEQLMVFPDEIMSSEPFFFPGDTVILIFDGGGVIDDKKSPLASPTFPRATNASLGHGLVLVLPLGVETEDPAGVEKAEDVPVPADASPPLLAAEDHATPPEG